MRRGVYGNKKCLFGSGLMKRFSKVVCYGYGGKVVNNSSWEDLVIIDWLRVEDFVFIKVCVWFVVFLIVIDLIIEYVWMFVMVKLIYKLFCG